MDFSWSEEQLALRQTAVDFARKELNNGLVERDQQAAFPHENWIKMAKFGVHGLSMPEQYGGTSTDIMTTMLIMEALGYGCRDNGLIFAVNAQMWSIQLPILSFGTEAQKSKYLPDLVSGKIIGAHGMTEPDSGSDAFSLRTKAKKVHGGYVLNGTKMYVTNGPVADMAIIFATGNADKGRWAISAFLVDKGTEGFSVSRDMKKMGLRTAPLGELILQDCFIPEENRLGPEGAGGSVFDSSMEWERSCILASHIGAMERQLEENIRFAKERKQYGQPIGKFQSVSNRIADMKVRLETARLMLYKVAWLKQKGRRAHMEAAIAKLFLSECFVNSSLDAIRVHGGYGYMAESEVERDLRDAVGGTIYSGTSDIQRTIIARLLGL